MKTLVIGASGAFGGAVTRELIRRGEEVTALVRPGGREVTIAGLWQLSGDALDRGAVARAAGGMDLIVFGFNVPYPQWATRSIRALEIVADVAAEVGATILFPGNVYGLGPDFSRPLAESDPRQPPTELGRLRNRMEARLVDATTHGARAIVVRAGDYLGPTETNAWFSHLTGKVLAGGPIFDPAAPEVAHAWAYLPDLAQVAVDLALRRHEFAPYAEFHYSGYNVTFEQMSAAVCQAIGPRKTKRFPWWALRLAAPIVATWRALLSLRYLWDQPVLLDDAKLRATLGEIRVTPLVEAVGASMRPSR